MQFSTNPVWLDDAKDRLVSTTQWRSLVAQAQALQGGASGPDGMKGPSALLQTDSYKIFASEAVKQLTEAVTELVPVLPSQSAGTQGESQTKIDVQSVASGLASLFSNIKDAKIGKHYMQRVRAEFIGKSLTPHLRRVLWPLLLSNKYCVNADSLKPRPPVTHVTAEEQADCTFRIQQLLATDAFQRQVHNKTNMEIAGWAAACAITFPDLQLGNNGRDLILKVSTGLLCGLMGDITAKYLEKEDFLTMLNAVLSLISAGEGDASQVRFDRPEETGVASSKISLQMGRALSFLDPELLRTLTSIGISVFKKNPGVSQSCPAAEYVIRPFTSTWFFGAMSLEASLFAMDQCVLAGFYVAAPCLLCGIITAPGVRGQVMFAKTKTMDGALNSAADSIEKLATRGDLSVEMLRKASGSFLEPLRNAASQGIAQSFSEAYEAAAAAGVTAMKSMPLPEYKLCANWRRKARGVVAWLRYLKGIKENVEKRRNLFLLIDPKAVVLKPMKTMGLDGQKIVLEMPPILPGIDTIGTAVARIMALENAQIVFEDDEELEVEFAEALSAKLRDKIPNLEDDSDNPGLRTTVDLDGKTRPLYFRPVSSNRDITVEVVRTLFHAHMRSLCINNDIVAALCRDLFVFTETVRRNVDAGEIDIPKNMQFGLPIMPDTPFCQHFKKGEVCVYGGKCGFTHGTEPPKPIPVKPAPIVEDSDDEMMLKKKEPVPVNPPVQAVQAPVNRPAVQAVKAPVDPAVQAPVNPPVQAPAPVQVPVNHPPVQAVQAPVNPAVKAPVNHPPVQAPVNPPVQAASSPPPVATPPPNSTNPPPVDPVPRPPPPGGSPQMARRASIASSVSQERKTPPPLGRQNTSPSLIRDGSAASLGRAPSPLANAMPVSTQLLLKVATVASSVIKTFICGDAQEIQENRVRGELRALERTHLLQQTYEEVLKKKLSTAEFIELRKSHHEKGNKVAKVVEKKLAKKAAKK